MPSLTRASTGLSGLDKVIDSLRLGDNVVWQVDSVTDYLVFVRPFVEEAVRSGRRMVYMRFGNHPPILTETDGITAYKLDALSGFEQFSTHVYNIVKIEGEEVFYVFDCLSDLLTAWATDLMIGNFFMITCPYLFELRTIAYFSILRNSHSFRTIARIRETTQLLVDIYNCDNQYYVHPLKVWNRYSATMFMQHLMTGNEFKPITSSVDITRLFSHMPVPGLENEKRKLDYWDRLFLDASDLYRRAAGMDPDAILKQEQIIKKLCSLIIGREKKILELSSRYFTLKDLLNIKSRLIGSGYIGGKAAGMLLARAVLDKKTEYDFKNILEPHDSFYIGSDVFYSYLVENGCWRLRMEQRSREGYFRVAPMLKEKLLTGAFPDSVREQFQQMLEYFGQSPIIVRSSSLLEDAFGNAFAGKYESIFCVNQGSPAQRYRQFEDAVRKVYASVMDEDALTYRRQRGLDESDEQMALLVQRVSGANKNGWFFPDVAGVGISYNIYVWNEGMDPKAGMLRIVHGLGTRAVDRLDGDYARIVALDRPLLSPHSGLSDTRKYSQHEVDVLDINQNRQSSVMFSSLQYEDRDRVIKLIASYDNETAERLQQLGMNTDEAWMLSFDRLLSQTEFPAVMGNILKTLEAAYKYPVDIEFTINFTENSDFRINILQCRPLQTKGLGKGSGIPEDINPSAVILKSRGNFMGGSIQKKLTRIIYIDPEKYSLLTMSDKYTAARAVGKLNRLMENRYAAPAMLAGPGRWGSSDPRLGIPVTFSEINNTAVLAELGFHAAGLMPELSYGTHFFQDLVEMDIFYAAFYPEKDTVRFEKLFESNRNLLTHLLSGYEKFEDVIKVVDLPEGLMLASDIISQQLICWIE